MVHPANEYLQYFSREAMKKEKEKKSGIEQQKSRTAAQKFFTRRLIMDRSGRDAK
jgi:hypothetical protein